MNAAVSITADPELGPDTVRYESKPTKRSACDAGLRIPPIPPEVQKADRLGRLYEEVQRLITLHGLEDFEWMSRVVSEDVRGNS